MKISKINIDGFGIFHDVWVNGLDSSRVILFHGQNEAGKSTMLGFIKTILFGFPYANSREINYPPLAGGAHGGELGLRLSDGRIVTVERSPGKRVPGDVRVTLPDGRTGSGELLQQLMGGVTFDVFKKIYAFSLTELQTFDTLKDDHVRNVIYGASMGSAMLALPKVEKELGDRLNQLFKPRGSRQLINQKLTEYEGIKAEFIDARQKQSEFDEMVRNLSEVEKNIQLIQHELFETNQAQVKFKSYSRLWPEWVKYQEDEKALALIPDTIKTFPPNGLQDLEYERNSLQTYQTTLQDLENELQQSQAYVESFVINLSVIDRAEDITYLWEQKNTYAEGLKIVPVMVKEEENIEKTIGQLLGNLGRTWTEERVLSVDKSIFTREKIRQFQNEFSKKDNDVVTTEKIRHNKHVAVDKSIQEVNEAIQLLEQIGEPEVEIDPQLIQRLQNGRNEYSNSVRDLTKCRNQLRFMRDKIASLIRDIDSTWNEAHVSQFDTSLSAKEAIEKFTSRLNTAQENSNDAKAQFKVVEMALLKAQDRLRIAHDKLYKSQDSYLFSYEELVKRKITIQQLQKTLFEQKEVTREIRHLKDRLDDKQQELARANSLQRRSPSPRNFMLAILLTTFFFFAVLIALQKWEAAVMAGLFFISTAIVLLYQKYGQGKRELLNSWESRSDSLNSRILTMQKDIGINQNLLSEIEAGIEEITKKLRLPVPMTHDSLAHEANRLEQDIRSMDEQGKLAHTLEKSEEEVKRIESELVDARKKVCQADQYRSDIKEKWKEHLFSLKLDPELTSTTVRDIFSKVEGIREQINNANGLTERIREMEAICNDYANQAGNVPELESPSQDDPLDFLAKTDTFLANLEDQRNHREKYQHSRHILEEKRKRQSLLEKEFQEANKTHHQAVEAKRVILSRWQDWLSDRRLPANLSPESTFEAFNLITLCTEKINQRNQMNLEIRNRKEQIVEFERRVNKLFKEINRRPLTSQKLTVALNELSSELEQSKGNLREKSQIERQIKKDKVRIQSTQRQIDRCRQRIGSLLEEGKASDEEEFRERGHLFLQREKLSTELAQEQRNMCRHSGETDFEKLQATLKQLSLPKIQGLENELIGKEKELQDEVESLRNRKAHLSFRISEMKSADDISRIRMDEERVREEIRGLAFEWSRYAMARFLIEKAKEKFEKEQQPKVIQDARVYFQKITNSGYHELVAPIGGNTIEVKHSASKRKKPEELSRGTAEQLYLSMRFGYIRNRSRNHEPLPIIMDDIFVNFDPGRLRKAVETVLELSKDHQILFFTCHPETIDIFKSRGKNIALYDIREGQVTKLSSLP